MAELDATTPGQAQAQRPTNNYVPYRVSDMAQGSSLQRESPLLSGAESQTQQG